MDFEEMLAALLPLNGREVRLALYLDDDPEAAEVGFVEARGRLTVDAGEGQLVATLEGGDGVTFWTLRELAFRGRSG